MTKEFLITFRSVTFAQRAERALRRENIFCRLQRTPKMLTTRGCGYCLRLREEDALYAVAVLQGEQIQYGKLYAIGADGTPQEQVL